MEVHVFSKEFNLKHAQSQSVILTYYRFIAWLKRFKW